MKNIDQQEEVSFSWTFMGPSWTVVPAALVLSCVVHPVYPLLWACPCTQKWECTESNVLQVSSHQRNRQIF